MKKTYDGISIEVVLLRDEDVFLRNSTDEILSDRDDWDDWVEE